MSIGFKFYYKWLQCSQNNISTKRISWKLLTTVVYPSQFLTFIRTSSFACVPYILFVRFVNVHNKSRQGHAVFSSEYINIHLRIFSFDYFSTKNVVNSVFCRIRWFSDCRVYSLYLYVILLLQPSRALCFTLKNRRFM